MSQKYANVYREMLPYGYISISGGKWADLQVDRYNAEQERINAFIKENKPIPEHLISSSFHLFCTFDRANAKF